MSNKIPVLIVLLMFAAGAGAQELYTPINLPPDVINTARDEFGDTMSYFYSSDLGAANDVPIGNLFKPDAFGPEQKIFIFRTPRPLSIYPYETQRFKVLVGDCEFFYIWPQGSTGLGVLLFDVYEVLPDGERVLHFSDAINVDTYQFITLSQPVSGDQPAFRYAEGYDFENLYQVRVFEIAINYQPGADYTGTEAENTRALVWVTLSPERLDEMRNGMYVPRGEEEVDVPLP